MYILILVCLDPPQAPTDGGASVSLPPTTPLLEGTTITYSCNNPTFYQLSATRAVCESNGLWNPPTIGQCTRFSKFYAVQQLDRSEKIISIVFNSVRSASRWC